MRIDLMLETISLDQKIKSADVMTKQVTLAAAHYKISVSRANNLLCEIAEMMEPVFDRWFQVADIVKEKS